jgi:hypothetical protein
MKTMSFMDFIKERWLIFAGGLAILGPLLPLVSYISVSKMGMGFMLGFYSAFMIFEFNPSSPPFIEIVPLLMVADPVYAMYICLYTMILVIGAHFLVVAGCLSTSAEKMRSILPMAGFPLAFLGVMFFRFIWNYEFFEHPIFFMFIEDSLSSFTIVSLGIGYLLPLAALGLGAYIYLFTSTPPK